MTDLPALAELLETARVVALPMHTRFRGVDVREALLFEGPEGWAEFSPFPEYGDEEAATWLEAAIADAWHPRPAALRDRIPVNATVPAVPAERVPAVLARFDGCRTAKVKVAEAGQTLADDIARVRAVRAEMGPEGRIRIDANAGWNVDEAERAIHALAPFDLEYAEQPCASVAELAELRDRIRYLDILIAADESVRKATDPLEVARAGAADLLVIKAQPSAASAARSASSRRRGSRPSSPVLSTPRSDCRSGRRWPRHCPRSSSTAAWAPRLCSPTTSPTPARTPGRCRPPA